MVTLSSLLNSATNEVILPVGVTILDTQLDVAQDGFRVIGTGIGRSILKCSAAMRSGHGIVLAGKNNCIFKDFTFDINASERQLSPASRFNGFNVQGNRNTWSSVEIFEAPMWGLLIDGNTIGSSENTVENAYIRDNGSTGLALNKANLSKITGNRFVNNGDENLTIDIDSTGNMVTNNHFLRHRGGCGNIGWDVSNGSVFADNYVNSENTNKPASGTRIGVCINSEAGVTTGAIISNNVIINNVDHGIFLRNRTGQPNPGIPNWNPGKPGDAMISGNYLRNNGIDIEIDDTDETICLGKNNYQTLKINGDGALNYRLSTGDAGAELGVQTEQLIPSGTGRFTTVRFDRVAFARSITAVGGVLYLPCGGFYSIDAKVRLDLSSAPGTTLLQMRVHTPGGNRVANQIVSLNTPIAEVSIAFVKQMPKGQVYVELTTLNGTGLMKIPVGDESWLSCAIVG